MAIQLQLRRGTTAENDAFTGAVAEVTVDTDTHELRVHDGATAGGFTVADKADMITALAGKADVATTLAGYGITDGANTDLSNLTSTGANIGNWSSNITNCITQIPQDIKLEFDTTTKILTLKAGSKLYVPNGASTFDIVNITTDQTSTNTFSGQYDEIFVCWDSANNTFRQTPTVNSGDTDSSTSANRIWYDTVNNKIKYYANSGTTLTSDSLSLPICIMQNAGGGNGFTKIQQVFNGFGYIGRSTFVLPGVKALSPNGRNNDGTCKNTKNIWTQVKTFTTPLANSSVLGFLSYPSLVTYGVNNYFESDIKPTNFGTYATWYDTKNNFIYNTTDGGTTWNKINSIYFGRLTKSANNNISFMEKHDVFRTVDYNDTEYIAHQAMPSDRYIDLTLGASQTYYTAPADGYFFIIKNGSQNEYCNMYLVPADSDDRLLGNAVVSNVSGALGSWIAAKKGQRAWVVYTASGSLAYFRFVYAEGAQ